MNREWGNNNTSPK